MDETVVGAALARWTTMGMKREDGMQGSRSEAVDERGRSLVMDGGVGVSAPAWWRGYNVTGDFDLSAIESAMEKISTARSHTGAVTNSMEHAFNYNTRASLELTGARSRIEDLDIPKAVSEQKKDKLLSDYRMGMLQKKMKNDNVIVKQLFGGM